MPPWVSTGWMPLLLALAALLAGLMAGQAPVPGWLLASSLVLSTAAALLAGALWGRQRQLDRLVDARQQAQLLGQLVDVWCWQTDAEHRLVKLQPPHGAPASAWVAGSFSGDCLWQRFDDAAHSLQPRMQAQGRLETLRVLQAPSTEGGPPRTWCLRGLPRLDARGRFAGYTGVAWPTDSADATTQAHQALDALLLHGPSALCLAVPDATGQAWQLLRASPAARRLLGLAAPADGAPPALPWAQALAGLPDALRQQVLALQPGGAAEADGWQARLHALAPPDSAADPAGGPCQGQLLLALAPTAAVADNATQALAAEHAAFSYTISHDLRAPLRARCIRLRAAAPQWLRWPCARARPWSA